MSPDLELIGPLWADFGGPAFYGGAVAIEVIVAFGLMYLFVRRRCVRSLSWWFGLSAAGSCVAVVLFNATLNAIVLLYFAGIYRGTPR